MWQSRSLFKRLSTRKKKLIFLEISDKLKNLMTGLMINKNENENSS